MADGDGPGPTVDIEIRDPGWRTIEGLEALTRDAVAAACRAAGTDRAAEISVVLADDALLRELNARYRGTDAPTNVLSFASDPPLLGDIVLSYETAACEARAQGKPVRDHLAHLLVHGTLHLLGYDHESEACRLAMESLEVEILAHLGVRDPYLIGDTTS